MLLPVLALFVAVATHAAAAPTAVAVKSSEEVTPLTPAQIAAFRPYTQFARAVGCAADNAREWNCGAPCDALPGFQTTANDGNNDSEQYWFVGFYPPLNSVIITHEGADLGNDGPRQTVFDIFPARLNNTLFPGAPEGVRVHDGFRREHERTADRILAAVKDTLANHTDASVTCIGHSLGAALSQLDAVSLRSQLPSTTSVKYVGYASPRVGNPDYANYVDAILKDFTRINNKKDPVPILPPKTWPLFPYRHPSGEIHIDANDQWLACPGQDSDAAGCINEIHTFWNSTPIDHPGPFDGLMIDKSACP